MVICENIILTIFTKGFLPFMMLPWALAAPSPGESSSRCFLAFLRHQKLMSNFGEECFVFFGGLKISILDGAWMVM